jgi:hypothetical protein
MSVGAKRLDDCSVDSLIDDGMSREQESLRSPRRMPATPMYFNDLGDHMAASVFVDAGACLRCDGVNHERA